MRTCDSDEREEDCGGRQRISERELLMKYPPKEQPRAHNQDTENATHPDDRQSSLFHIFNSHDYNSEESEESVELTENIALATKVWSNPGGYKISANAISPSECVLMSKGLAYNAVTSC